MKISYALTALTVSALVSTSALAGGGAVIVGSVGGSYSNVQGGNAGYWANGNATAQGSVNGVSVGGAWLNNSSTSDSLSVVGGGGLGIGNKCCGGSAAGLAAANTSASNNNIVVGSAGELVQSNTTANSASGVGFGAGGSSSLYVGGNVAGIGFIK